MNNENTRTTYLQMIQELIARMATTSAVFKGFCATIIAGMSVVSFTEINKWVLVLAIAPVFCFCILDIYYLQLEKRFRALYNMVRTEQHEVDFDLNPPKARSLKCEEASIWYCVKSPSIMLFYLPLVLISTVIIIMKFKGVM